MKTQNSLFPLFACCLLAASGPIRSAEAQHLYHARHLHEHRPTSRLMAADAEPRQDPAEGMISPLTPRRAYTAGPPTSSP